MANTDFTLKLRGMLDTKPIEKDLKVLSEKVKITIKTDGTQVTNTTKKLADDMGKVYVATERVNSATGKTTTSMTGLAQETAKVKQGFTDIVTKVGKFLLATTIIGGFTTALYGAFDTVMKFDTALTEFKKVSDLSGGSLDTYTDKLKILGSEVARTRTEMVEASTQFKKGGYDESTSALLAKTASLYQNIADKELSAGDASAFIISQMKAFNITASESSKVIDSVNEVKFCLRMAILVKG